MRLNAQEYIALMDGLGLFSAGNKLPEQNTAVWRQYLNLYDAHAGPVADIDIIATADGMGFYCDPLMGEETWSWALTSPLSHPVIPFTAAQLIGGAGEVEALFEKADVPVADLITESFQFKTGVADNTLDSHFSWVNSPLALFAADFDSYVGGLAPERRKQARRLYRQYNENSGVRFDFSDRPPDAVEFTFIAQNTADRWGADEAPFALAQTLWPMAAAAILPAVTRFCRVYAGDDLIFFNSYIIRDGVITSQATCRKEGVVYNGLGVMIDFKTIELLTGGGIVHGLDPTCMTGVIDPGSIITAKREVINTEAQKPIFSLRPVRLKEIAPDLQVPSFQAGNWSLPPQVAVLGRGV